MERFLQDIVLWAVKSSIYHLTVRKIKRFGKSLSDFQTSFFQKLSMMWTSTIFQYF